MAGLAALALAGGFAVVGRTVGHQHEVTVSADGKELSRITGADTVGAVLASAGVWVGPFDRVEPGPETPLRDGLEIAVRRAVPVVVEVDGEARTVMTASGTVTDLRAELGLPRRLAERTGPETLGPGATVVLRTPHAVTLVVDGSVRALDTTALTVAELLEDEGVTLGEEDEVVPAPTERLAGRSVVSVTRVESGLRTREVAVPFATRRVEDPSLALGRTEVVQTGRTGVERIVSLATVHDGELVSDEVVTTVTVEEPVDQVVRVGTRPAAPAPSGSGSRVETGQATWYEITPGTCAHKTIPKGTVVKVTNLQTGAWTTCVVADRGPYAAGRIIDLSHTTFAELAPRSTGVIPVRIEW
ncbi:MAG: ubiquitin-like domain-containing protein [Acidimicrobiia bacterium]|nr:ubiquitin-like domain-containing protein [Acidimicrobiia bacterium]